MARTAARPWLLLALSPVGRRRLPHQWRPSSADETSKIVVLLFSLNASKATTASSPVKPTRFFRSQQRLAVAARYFFFGPMLRMKTTICHISFSERVFL